MTRLARAAAARPVPALSPEAMATVLTAAPTRPPARAVAVGLGQFLLGVRVDR